MSLPLLPRAWSVFMLAGLIMRFADAQEISWTIPEDGGTPRDTNRIEQLGTREFRIRAAFEEGGQSVLRHAVSRVDVLCRNDGSKAVKVTVQIDCSASNDECGRGVPGIRISGWLRLPRPARHGHGPAHIRDN